MISSLFNYNLLFVFFQHRTYIEIGLRLNIFGKGTFNSSLRRRSTNFIMKTDLESVYLKILTETCDNEQGPVPKPRPWAHSQASHYSLALENSGVNSHQNPLFAMLLLSHKLIHSKEGVKWSYTNLFLVLDGIIRVGVTPNSKRGFRNCLRLAYMSVVKASKLPNLFRQNLHQKWILGEIFKIKFI